MKGCVGLNENLYVLQDIKNYWIHDVISYRSDGSYCRWIIFERYQIMPDIIDNSKEEKQQKKADKRYERVLSDVRRVCQLPEGRRTLRKIMEDGAPFRDAYSGEVNSTMYNLGRQSVSRNVLNTILDSDPKLLPLIETL